MTYFYQVRFGDYLIAMNTTKKGSYRENTFQLYVPEKVAASKAKDLLSGKMVNLSAPLSVPPDTTVILYLGH